MKRVFLGALLALVVTTSFSVHVHAQGLKVAPLEYRTKLKANERQKGFIDISNPSGETINIETSVQAFRQINNEGGLQFYSDKQLSSGIKTDLSNFKLGPRQAIRMFFMINGRQLPEGDVYGAIFFTSSPHEPINGVGQMVRVGTILSIINKTPGERVGLVTGLNIPFFQLSDTVRGSYKVKNTGNKLNGFYPVAKVSAWPFGEPREYESSLVFGGRERSNDFTYKTGIGIHRIDVSYKNSQKSKWVIMITPLLAIITGLVALIIATELILLKRRRKKRQKTAHSTPKR